MASRPEGTPRSGDEISASDAKKEFYEMLRERYLEYTTRLCPIADEDLPPALRDAYLQGNTDEYPRRLLHFGFQCPIPHKPHASKVIFDGLDAVNDAVGWPKTLEVVMALVQPRNTTFVAAVYSNDAPKDPVFTPKRIERIGRELRKVFGHEVQGPMWYWDTSEHGPGKYSHKPFDEAYPMGHPAEFWY